MTLRANFKSSIFLLAFISVFSIFLSAGRCYAASSGLSISPVRAEYEINPGTKQSNSLKITNNYDKTISVSLSAEEFNVLNQNYDYIFTENSDVVKWVGFEEINIELEAGETREIGYSIGVPNNAEPGGRYVSLFASTDVLDDKSVVLSKQRVASLIYLTVAGDVIKTGSLINLNAPWLVVSGGNWSATIRNSGTTHFHSFYSSNVYDIFGNLKWTYSGDSLIMPASIRSIVGDNPNLIVPGIYFVDYVVSLGDLPQAEKRSILIYLPVWFSVLVILVILLILSRILFRKMKSQSV